MKTQLKKDIENLDKKVESKSLSLLWKFLSFINKLWKNRNVIILVGTITLVIWIIIMYFAWK